MSLFDQCSSMSCFTHGKIKLCVVDCQSSSKKGGEYWLVWRFEGEATLQDLMLSKEFPYNVGVSHMLPF